MTGVNKLRILGITGGVGTGKSTVTAEFEKLGYGKVSADEVAHRIILKGRPAYAKLLAFFGRSILGKGGAIDRRKLGRLAFKDGESRRALDKITHPEIIREIKTAIKKELLRKETVCLEAPLLFEAGLEGLAGAVLVVYALKKTQLRRLAGKGYSKKEAESRLEAQLPLEEKIRRADFVIVNEVSRSALKAQVQTIHKILQFSGSQKKA